MPLDEGRGEVRGKGRLFAWALGHAHQARVEPVPATASPPSRVANDGETVRVRAGDTLSELVHAHLQQQGARVSAELLYARVREVADRNGLDNADEIWPGQTLTLDDAPAPLAAGAEIGSLNAAPRIAGIVQDLVMPVQGRLTSGFGTRKHPILGHTHFHRGIDLAAPRGTPVVAVADGIVESVGVRSGYGNTITVRHADGRSTLYAHLDAMLVRPGRSVAAGEVIAQLGNTGRSTGPHLHFEVHENGRPVDPWPLLQSGERLLS